MDCFHWKIINLKECLKSFIDEKVESFIDEAREYIGSHFLRLMLWKKDFLKDIFKINDY
jgi:hypothetical protein